MKGEGDEAWEEGQVLSAKRKGEHVVKIRGEFFYFNITTVRKIGKTSFE